MLLAQALTGPQIILMGLSLLVTAFVVRRTIKRSQQSRISNRRSQPETGRAPQAVTRHSDPVQADRVRDLEIRLHDYGREIEGRVQTTLAVLDQLLASAEIESQRLEKLVDDAGSLTKSRHRRPTTESGDSAPRTTTSSNSDGIRKEFAHPEQDRDVHNRRMIRHLFDAGFSIDDIAVAFNQSQTQIRLALDEADPDQKTDAA